MKNLCKTYGGGGSNEKSENQRERERQRLRGRKGGLGKEKISQWFKIGP